jgi:hypothetical protein
VAFQFNAEGEIDWIRPQATPSGFDTVSVFTGQQGGSASPPLEIAVATWSKPGEPNRDAISKLHQLRVNQRVTPVVLIVEIAGGAAVLFGPNASVAPTKSLPVDQVERIVQAVLDETTPVAARTRLTSLLQSLETTSIPGVKNSGLFANHELKDGVPLRKDWSRACDTSLPLLTLRDHELIERLGYQTASAGAHALVLTGKGPRPEAIAVMLEDSETFDADSQRFSVSPVAYGLKMAEQTGVPWLILSRGSQLRLYAARIDLGVGRKGLAETFFEVDLPQLTRETAGYLNLIFSAPALGDGGSAFEIMHASMIYAVALGGRLRDKVYEDIVPRLSVAVADQLAERGYEMDASGLDLAYQLTLRIFFRMLFQIYAEDRKLLPFGENEKYDRNALKTVALDLVEIPDQPFDENSTSLWDDLAQVWRVIDKGDKAWSVPAYNGGLFASDPELNEYGAVIETLTITNDVIGPCLKALLLDESDDIEFGPIDFRSLSVREFGTIYEGLLEASLSLAEVDLTLDDKKTWIPAKKGDVVETKAGEVYFHNISGQRKGTGSYYTPTFVVEHLLERSLDPALDAHFVKVAELIDAGDQTGAADLFFDFRVADLAMGSGHFLTAAIDHIERKMAAFLEEEGHEIPGVVKEIILLGNAARDAIGDPDGPLPEGSSLLRRQIARRCIYGLDINPIAVELARVAIWIHTFVRGLPMSSLDHNLVCANSLTGIGSIDEALNVLVPGRNGAGTLFDAPIEDALRAAQAVLADVAQLPEINRKETQAASRAVRNANAEAERARLLFDAAVLNRIGRGDLVDAVDPMVIADLANTEAAHKALAALAPGHMPVLFPEVFVRDDGGFDVLVGNPPWDMVHIEMDVWWGKYIPGARGLPVKEMNAAIERLRKQRPDLETLFDSDRESSDHLRAVLMAGPYPGLGSGHLDLYQAFAWRNWQMSRGVGRIAMVLPRVVLSGSGSSEWRKCVLESGRFDDVVVAVNNKKWIFEDVDGRYSVTFMAISKSSDQHEALLSGPFFSQAEMDEAAGGGVVLQAETLLRGSPTAAFPSLSSKEAGQVFEQMRTHPGLSENTHFEFRPVQGDLNGSSNRDLFSLGASTDSARIPVLAGASFTHWDADFGPPYGTADAQMIQEWLLEKSETASRNRRSAHFGIRYTSFEDLQMQKPRIVYRAVTNATNTRTVVPCLIPPGSIVTHAAPYLLRRNGGDADEAFLLGVMSSVPYDWYLRKWVELNLTFELLVPAPVPDPELDDPRRLRVISISGRLAAKDGRYQNWADAVQVSVGSVKSTSEQDELEAILDANVSSLYGLTREQVEHVFATFHRGWNFAPRLAKVLGYFDAIEEG